MICNDGCTCNVFGVLYEGAVQGPTTFVVLVGLCVYPWGALGGVTRVRGVVK
jgi:hypothetical protein